MTPTDIAEVARILAAFAVVFMGVVWVLAFVWAAKH